MFIALWWMQNPIGWCGSRQKISKLASGSFWRLQHQWLVRVILHQAQGVDFCFCFSNWHRVSPVPRFFEHEFSWIVHELFHEFIFETTDLTDWTDNTDCALSLCLFDFLTFWLFVSFLFDFFCPERSDLRPLSFRKLVSVLQKERWILEVSWKQIAEIGANGQYSLYLHGNAC